MNHETLKENQFYLWPNLRQHWLGVEGFCTPDSLSNCRISFQYRWQLVMVVVDRWLLVVKVVVVDRAVLFQLILNPAL